MIMDKLKLAFTWVIIIGVIVSGLYWISNEAEKDNSITINAINRGCDYSKGIITNMHSYKGNTIEVEYKIREVKYVCTKGWDKNPRHLGVGDSISLKYAVENANLIITELESDY